MSADAVQRVWGWCRSGGLAVGAAGSRRVLQLGRRWQRLLWWSCRPLGLLLRMLVLATAMFIALQLAHLSQSLATIAQAQAITGFAVMRSLQAHGERAQDALARPGTPVPGPWAPASAIDARRLESPTPAHGP